MPTNFNDSFRPVVELRPGHPCFLKRHFAPGSILREIAGEADRVAAQDPGGERFVWLRMETLLERCHDFKHDKRRYSERHFFRGLDFLREEIPILSQVSKVKRKRGHGTFVGFLVAHHDIIFAPSPADGTQCCYIGLSGRAGLTGDRPELRIDPEGYVKVYPRPTEDEIAAMIERAERAIAQATKITNH